MKSFILKSSFFCLIPTLLYVCTWTFLKTKFKKNIDSHSIILLGDSQTKFIKFPEIYNRSIEGSPYFVHFEFAKEFINEIKNKEVYIALNYQNLSKLYQNRLANDSLYSGWRSSTFKTMDEYNFLNYKHPEIRPTEMDYTVFDIKKLPTLIYKLYFLKADNNSSENILKDTLSINNAIERHWLNPKYKLDDLIQKQYINKLIILLKEHGCDVILLKMPLTNYYKKNVPNEVKMELFALANKHKIHLLDLDSLLSISNDYKYFKDYGHLNKKGDSLVTDFFTKKELKAGTHNSRHVQ